jgi:hypothetical protein
VENLLSKDHLIYHEAKGRILNLPSTIIVATGVSSKNSKPQHEANAIFFVKWTDGHEEEERVFLLFQFRR